MAEEISGSKPEGQAGTSDEGVINLEDLVKNIDAPAEGVTSVGAGIGAGIGAGLGAAATSDGGSKSDIGSSPAPSVPAVPIHAEALSPEKIEEILLVEDPALLESMGEIRKHAIDAAQDIKSIESEVDRIKRIKRGPMAAIRSRIDFMTLAIGAFLGRTRAFGNRVLKDGRGVARELVIEWRVNLLTWLRNERAYLKNRMAWVQSRSIGQRLALLLSAILLLVAILVAGLTIQGRLLPGPEQNWLGSFSDQADAVFDYDPNGEFEDFNDPLLHPEFVVLVDRVVVNLKRTSKASDDAMPMAALELYVQTDNQLAAIEIKDRMVAIKDTIARSVERMSSIDLAEESGKTKLKLLIRKDINEILIKGRVRKVYLKTLVLNPETE